MEIKDLDLRPHFLRKNSKIKDYENLRKSGRIVFFKGRTITNPSGVPYLMKCWYNKFGGGMYQYYLSELGYQLYEKLPHSRCSISEENFKLLIQSKLNN